MKRALRAIFSLLLIAAFVQSAQVIIAAGTPDIFKELGKQIKDDISDELRNGSRNAVRDATDEARQKKNKCVIISMPKGRCI